MNQNLKNITYKTLLIGSIWFIVALLISCLTILTQLRGAYSYSNTLSILGVIAFESICILPWAISTPFIIWVTRRYLLSKDNIWAGLSTQLITALFVFVFHSIIQSYAASVFYESIIFEWVYLKIDFVGFLDMRLMLYIGVVLIAYAIDYQQKIRESTMREPLLKAQLNKARYQALLNQIQPRFLLSSISAIREKIRGNPKESEEILTDFSDLLRIMLQNANKELVTIREDLDSYYLYFNLIQKRVGKKIEIKTNISKGCHDALVPSCIMLISLFEAFIFSNKRDKPTIKGTSYNAGLKDDMIHIEMIIAWIRKSNRTMPKQLQNGRVQNIRQNLHNIYARPIRLEADTNDSAMSVKLSVPFRLQKPEVLNEIPTVDSLFTLK